jgi:hypothetical protein
MMCINTYMPSFFTVRNPVRMEYDQDGVIVGERLRGDQMNRRRSPRIGFERVSLAGSVQRRKPRRTFSEVILEQALARARFESS